jgi:hypothetical protein
MMMGADLYETEDEISRLLSEGNVPIGVGENTKIRWVLDLKHYAMLQLLYFDNLSLFVVALQQLHHRHER